MCIRGINGTGVGPSYNLYIGGVKPAATFPAPGINPITENGLTHTVFTTNALQAVGLGYIVRWRASGTGINGQWVTPPANWGTEWMPPPTAGIPFYRARTRRFPPGNNTLATCLSQNLLPPMNNLQDWWNTVNSSSEKRYCLTMQATASLRYVLIKPANQIAHQLDPLSHTVTIQSEILKARPGAVNQNTKRWIVPHTVNLTIKPWGTCTTPSVTVPFGSMYPGDLPSAPGPVAASSRTFNLVLKDCPRVNVEYFFRAPPGITVDNTNGVVGLSTAPGNAQGIGVQLAHNGGTAGTNPVQFNQNGNTTTYTRTPAMGQNDPVTGITHTIPMRASVYRTSAAPVVPGSVNASVWMYIQYP